MNFNKEKFSLLSSEYDRNVRITLPFYEHFFSEAIDLIRTVNSDPKRWLDTGCGTGTLVEKALGKFPDTEFVLCDPSEKMFELAKHKDILKNNERICFDACKTTQDLTFQEESFDVITAIQAHHYMDVEQRQKATDNCFRMLKLGGIYVTFENIKPYLQEGIDISLNRWKQFQLEAGKSEEEAAGHIARFGKEYYPITINEHLKMLKNAEFRVFEHFWLSHMQAGFYGIK